MAANGNRSTSPAKKDAVALDLAKGLAAKEAAANHRVGERTVARWKTDPAFIAKIQEYRSELFAEAVGALCALSKHSVVVLGHLLKSENEAIRLSAAKAVLEIGSNLRKMTDLEARVAAIEARDSQPPLRVAK